MPLTRRSPFRRGDGLSNDENDARAGDVDGDNLKNIGGDRSMGIDNVDMYENEEEEEDVVNIEDENVAC
jgi:hypothetical protein